MADGPIKVDVTPKRFTLIAAIFLAVIALLQAARIFYGFDVQVGTFHVPMGVSWGVVIVFGLVAVLAFREAET